MAMSRKPPRPAPRRCAKAGCPERQPCPRPGHNTKQWGNTEYYTPIPKRDKDEVIRQSGGICRKCGRRAPGQVDHIVNVARGGKNEMSNYQYLCIPCHDEKTRREIKYGKSCRHSRPDNPSR